MSKDYEGKIGSTIYTRIQALNMPEADRQRALSALYDANLYVDGIVWAAKKIEQLGARLFLRPALKH